jgi:hypothetical protein
MEDKNWATTSFEVDEIMIIYPRLPKSGNPAWLRNLVEIVRGPFFLFDKRKALWKLYVAMQGVCINTMPDRAQPGVRSLKFKGLGARRCMARETAQRAVSTKPGGVPQYFGFFRLLPASSGFFRGEGGLWDD